MSFIDIISFCKQVCNLTAAVRCCKQSCLSMYVTHLNVSSLFSVFDPLTCTRENLSDLNRVYRSPSLLCLLLEFPSYVDEALTAVGSHFISRALLFQT